MQVDSLNNLQLYLQSFCSCIKLTRNKKIFSCYLLGENDLKFCTPNLKQTIDDDFLDENDDEESHGCIDNSKKKIKRDG